MASVPVPNTAMAELRFLYDNEPIENTLYFKFAAPATLSDLSLMGNSLAVWWVDNMAPLSVSALTLREVFCTDINSAIGPITSVTTGLPAQGLINLDGEAGNVAACISLRTANRGRSFRGRNYIAGIPDNVVTLSTMTEAYVNDVTTAYNNLIALATDFDATWVVVSRYSGMVTVNGKRKPLARVSGLATPIVLASFTDRTVDSMRPRLPNH